MAWWTNPNIQIKQKNRFIMSIGEFLIPTVVSVDKPSISIESKEYTMINHVYRYPGIAKWQPITVTFVDGSGNSKKQKENFNTEIMRDIDNLDAAQFLYRMLLGSGYTSGRSVSGATSKTNMRKSSLSNSVRIEQIEPDGSTVSEGWRLHNPIFTDIKWGSLSYADDGAVEYTLTIAYDWAEFYVGGQISAGDLKIKDSMRTSGRVADLIKNYNTNLVGADPGFSDLERFTAQGLAAGGLVDPTFEEINKLSPEELSWTPIGNLVYDEDDF